MGRARTAVLLCALAGLGVGLPGTGLADEKPAEQNEVRAAERVIVREEPAGQAQGVDEEAIKQAVREAVDEQQSNLRPGFMMALADEELSKQLAKFNGYLDQLAWGEAFRQLSELDGKSLEAMVASDDKGLHLAVRVMIQRRLLAMPADGRRAFQLYFDGQAKEMLNAVKQHPRPGSEEQLATAQKLVDRLLASSVGGEAAELLGDLYFERGNFARAGRNWKLSLDHGGASGRDALRLQIKQAWAMLRDGDQAAAQALYDQLKSRYDDATLTLGGSQVDALAMLNKALQELDVQKQVNLGSVQGDVYRLPRADAQPAWNLTYLNPTHAAKVASQANRGYYYYRSPNLLTRYVPPVEVDQERVYFHWLGVVFALDRETGKMLWQSGSIEDTAESAQMRLQSSSSDPCNYAIAQSENAVLVVSTAEGDDEFRQMVLKAYDKTQGGLIWSSDSRNDWTIDGVDKRSHAASPVGKVLVSDGIGYVVVHAPDQSGYFLRRFDADTGQVHWTLPLGDAAAITFYDEMKQFAQPQLLMDKGLLYVMTNNGALLAVDTAAAQVEWAIQMDLPFGVGKSTEWNGIGEPLTTTLEKMANPNGSGTLLLRNGVLYALQHYGSTLFALDANRGEVLWSANGLDRDARLIEVDDRHFYTMNARIRAYRIDGDHALAWNNPNTTFRYDQNGAIFMGGQILTLSNNMLRLAQTDNGDFVSTFKDDDYLGQQGGTLYRFDNLLLVMTRTQLTAYRLEMDGVVDDLAPPADNN